MISIKQTLNIILRITPVFCCLYLLSSCSSDDSASEESETNTAASILEVTNISENSATVSGTAQVVQGSSILAKGFCWGTNTNPTVETDSSIDEGTNPGDYTSTISGLFDNTEYHVRAYVTTEVETFYSNGQTFTTTALCNGGAVYNGDPVNLNTQAEVDAFGAMGYCEVNTSLGIGDRFIHDDKITDISPLLTIEKVKGIFIENTLLQDLDPLQNLRSSQYISVRENENLVNVDALINIHTPVRAIRITNNPKLLNIDGLANVKADTQIAPTGTIDFIRVYGNPLLQNIDGLSGITAWIKGDIDIRNNMSLQNINGFENLTHLDRVFVKIERNGLLQHLDGFQNLVIATECEFEIKENQNVQHIDGLSNITGVILNFSFKGHPLVTNINALGGLSRIDSINLDNNPSLTNLNGLSSVEIWSSVIVSNNESLTGLEGINNLGGDLYSFEIYGNNLLSDFCSLTQPFSTAMINIYNVHNNAYNPTQQDIIDGNCSL
tara:strand:+ start:33998 stop:35482 length:1485 start_codon:yes stop_codon:yes gene_type:complete